MTHESEEEENIALAAGGRAEIVEGKFRELKIPRKFNYERVKAARANQMARSLIHEGRESVSTAWFAWYVDFNVWSYIHEKFAKHGDHETFPWIDLEPAVKPKTPEDASAWFNGLKDAIKQKYDLPALERKKLGLTLMRPENYLVRDLDKIAARWREDTWNNVFPGREPPHGKAFEVIVPSAVEMFSDLKWDVTQKANLFPATICLTTVGRVHRRGHFVMAIVLGYNSGVIDDPENRLILAKTYDVVLKCAINIIITGKSTKLTRAFKGFDLPEPELDDDGEDAIMGGMGDEMELTQEQLALCAEGFDVVPLTSIPDYAVFRVSEWLHREVGRTSAEDRCRLLRDWCQLEDGKFHQNLEGMTREDLQKACHEAWMEKTNNWKETLDLTVWSWTEEVCWAKKIAEPFDS
ncbi:hypothetical protein CaCOL14_012519 [Colletotrichum acutatum]|uniref:Uncharacterized protein n=1 Tax=Glomerella acutata TaxID=27357 RepID=A0AAD8U975_GLOAC|nr:uncharacterized protein BDZ83DRAFT_656171 [Colletotrichum acutatum]KAK1713794.1 hypothetical protein BDZ83DRAFT_656171 [Colletotrichum acutatum]